MKKKRGDSSHGEERGKGEWKEGDREEVVRREGERKRRESEKE